MVTTYLVVLLPSVKMAGRRPRHGRDILTILASAPEPQAGGLFTCLEHRGCDLRDQIVALPPGKPEDVGL